MNPSILVTPNSKKAGKLDSIIPTDGTGDLDVVRATTATYVDADGLIKTALANEPRFDYSNGSCPSILVEPQRTNLDPNSQTFNGWVLSNSGGVTISSVNSANPFGFSSVSKIIPTTTLGQHRPYIISNYSAAGRMWVIAKADGYNFLSLAEGGAGNGASIIFNLLNGTISGSAIGYTPEITSLGDGWYKCSLNMAAFNINVSRWVIIRNNDTTDDYSGDGTSGILIAHKQLEVGSFDTSAIITSGTIATRNADVISKSGISDLIGQTEGTIYCEINNTFDGDSDTILELSDGSSSNRIRINRLINNRIQLIIINSGSITVNLFNSPNPNIEPIKKIAIGYAVNNVSMYVNGVLIGTDTNTLIPSLNILNLGSRFDSTNVFYDKISKVSLLKTRLSNIELQQLTTL